MAAVGTAMDLQLTFSLQEEVTREAELIPLGERVWQKESDIFLSLWCYPELPCSRKILPFLQCL